VASPSSLANSGSTPRKNASTKQLFQSFIHPYAGTASPNVVIQNSSTYTPQLNSSQNATANGTLQQKPSLPLYNNHHPPSQLDLPTIQKLNMFFLERLLKFACPFCFSRFTTQETLQQHITSLHQQQVMQMTSNFDQQQQQPQMSSKRAPAQQQGVTKKRPYQCMTLGCTGFKAEKSRDFLHHLKEVHGETFEIFYCDQCYYATKESTKLAKHGELAHSKVVSMSCKFIVDVRLKVGV